MKLADIMQEIEGPREPRVDERLTDSVKRILQRQRRRIKIHRPEAGIIGFPELIVEVPDSWPHVDLAPLFDVHLGHSRHDSELFMRHYRWLRSNPYTLTFDGGDFIENASKLSVGAGVYEQDYDPNSQMAKAVRLFAGLWSKLLFKLPGNHEARSSIIGLDIAAWIAAMVGVPYFPDFCFCTIRYAGNNFRLLAHHGTGAATTAGAQRMAARKMTSWAKGFDIFWTGHLHNPLLDVLFQTDFDRDGRAVERNAMIVISPSYLRYFRTYAASKMYPPGPLGLHVLRLHKDGRIDASIHARGKRI